MHPDRPSASPPATAQRPARSTATGDHLTRPCSPSPSCTASPPPPSSTIFLLLNLFAAVGVPPPLHVPWSPLEALPPTSLRWISHHYPSFRSPDPLLTPHRRLAVFRGAPPASLPPVAPCCRRPALGLPPSLPSILSDQDSLLVDAPKQPPFLASPGVLPLFRARPPPATCFRHRPVTLQPRSPRPHLFLSGSNLAAPSRSFVLAVSFTQPLSMVFSVSCRNTCRRLLLGPPWIHVTLLSLS